MNMKRNYRAGGGERGLIKLLLVIIVAVVLLNYFHIDLVALAERYHIKPLFLKLWAQLGLVWQQLVNLWHYLT